ncbi:MAG: GntT/GntP/DsdX family permease [Propionibacteriaceae bacterium]
MSQTDRTPESEAAGRDGAGGPKRIARVLGLAVAAIALVICIAVPVFTEQPGLWGLVPIVVYAVLVIIGFNILLSTAFVSALAIIMAQLNVEEIGTLLTDSLGSFIATIGLIIMLGAGLGAIVRETGAASALVHGLVNKIGADTPGKVQLGIMISSTVLVGSLGTLAGANAILAPIIIPIAARVKWSKPAVASMFLTAGAAGNMLGPFTPPVVTVMGVTDLNYLEYLYSAGIPMAASSWIAGFFAARWVQKRTRDSDPYSNEDMGQGTNADVKPVATRQANIAAGGFVLSIIVLAIVGVLIKASFSYAVLVMLAAALITALLGRLGAERAISTFTKGAASLIWLFFLFWMFNPLLTLVEASGSYDVMLNSLSPTMESAGAWVFLMLSLLIGWLAVPGAAVAQVTLIDKLLWPLAASLGVPQTAWATSLLGGSNNDTFGPFPNGDMIGQMGLARSSNLKMMLFTGWFVMTANVVVLAVMFAIV